MSINKLQAEFEKLQVEVQKPNIVLIGGTGVGKSSLLNHIFGDEWASSGTGRPITQTMDSYESSDSKVVIFDSKGYEVGGSQEKEFVADVLGKCVKNGENPRDQVHIAWYLIQASSARVTDFDISSIQAIQRTNTPVAILFTKSDLVSDNDIAQLKAVVSEEVPSVNMFEISISTDLPSDLSIYFNEQLTKLVDWSCGQLPESLKLAFISEQKINLESKREKAREVVLQHTASAAAVGFVPIPGADAPILLANQYGLLARVLYIYGMDSEKDKFSAPIKAAIAQLLPTIGKWGVAQLIKLVPGIGSVVGGIINAAVASSLTSAFGYAMSETAYIIRQKGIDNFVEQNENFASAINEIFMEVLNDEIKKARL